MNTHFSPNARTRLLLVSLAVSLIGAVCASCAPAPTGPSPQAQFCDLWDRVVEDPPAPDAPVEVDEDVLAYAEEATLVGSSCEAPGARVELPSAILSDADPDAPPDIVFEDALEPDPDEPEPVARALVNGDDLGPGQIVLDSLALTSLSASISTQGIHLSGAVAVRLSGVTSTIGFSGHMASLEDWSVTLTSSTLRIPGISSTPLVFTGVLRSVRGVTTLSLAASATRVEIGEITVTNALIDLSATPAGVAANVRGTLHVGPTTAAGQVAVRFDARGNLVAAEAEAVVRLVGFHVGGTTVDLQGRVRLDGDDEATTVSFTGSGEVADLLVHEATGELELGEGYARFDGVLDASVGTDVVRLRGAIVWDGPVAYTEPMIVEADGQISGTLPDGELVKLDGQLSLENVGGHLRTVFTGDFAIGQLRASGSALVEMAGGTFLLDVDATVQLDDDSTARVLGEIELVDGRAELVDLDASVVGSLTLGDVTISDAHLEVNGGGDAPLDIDVGGNLAIRDRSGKVVADLDGSLDATFADGELQRLAGDVQGDFFLKNFDAAGKATISVTGKEVTAKLQDVKLFLEGATLNLGGTLKSSTGLQDWVLKGSGRLVRDGVDVKINSAVVTPEDGFVAVAVKVQAGGIFFVHGDLQFFGPENCRFIVTQGGLVARRVAKKQIESKLGCSWHRRGTVKASQTWLPEE